MSSRPIRRRVIFRPGRDYPFSPPSSRLRSVTSRRWHFAVSYRVIYHACEWSWSVCPLI